MSTTIDERVVEMRFENKDFERNVSTSLGTIEKLKKSLDFSDSTKSVESFGKSLGNLSFDGISNTLSAINEKISAGGALALGVISKIGSALTEHILGNLNKISSALKLDTLDAINNMVSGWNKYADKTTGVATIMAATGESIETVNAQLEKLNYFTDETSYDFADMVNNIGKFTSNGIKLEEASVAMEGISTWAALSGQNAGVASRAMYNLAQAIGMGALKLQDWKSIELANMGTKEFKETALQTAAALGKIKDNGNGVYTFLDESGKKAKEVSISYENFRETLASGWLDSDVLMETLKEYGKAAEVINDLHEATGLYAADIMDLVEASKDHKLSIQEIKDALGDEDSALANNKEALEEVIEKVEQLASAEYEFSLKAYLAAQEAKTFGDAMAAVADAVSTGWMNTFELLFGNYETAKELWTDLANNLIEIFGAGNDARNSLLKAANNNGWSDLTEAIEDSKYSLDDFETSMRKLLTPQLSNKLLKQFGSYRAAFEAGAIDKSTVDMAVLLMKNFTDAERAEYTFIDATGKSKGALHDFVDALAPQGFQKNFVQGLKNIGAIAVEVSDQIRSTFGELFPQATPGQLRDFAQNFRQVTGDILETVKKSEKLKNALAALLAPFKAVEMVAAPVFKLIWKIVKDVTSAIVALLQPFGEFTRKLATGSKDLSPFERFLKGIGLISYKGFTLFVEVVGKLWDYLKDNVIEKVTSGMGKLKEVLDNFSVKHLDGLREFWKKFKDMNADDVIGLMSEKLDTLKKKLKEFLGIEDGEKFSLSNFFKDIGLESVSNLFDKLSTKFQSFKDQISKISETKGVSTLTAAFELVASKIEKAWYSIKTYDFAGVLRKYGFENAAKKIEDLGKWFDDLKTRIENLSKSEGLSKVSATFRTLIDDLKTKFGTLGINLDGAKSGFENLVAIFDWVKEQIHNKLESVKTSITNFFNAHGIDVLNLLKSSGVVVVVTKVIELLNKLSEIKKLQLGGLPQAVSPVVATVGLLKKIGTAAMVVSFVVAVKDLSIALAELGKLSVGDLVKSLGTLLVAMTMILVVFTIMKKIATVSKDDKNTVKMISSMAGLVIACMALQKFAKVLQTYSDFDYGSMANAIKILVILHLAVHTFKTLAKAVGKSNFKLSNGLGLILTATALKKFGDVLEDYSKLKIEQGSTLKILGTLFLAILTFSRIATSAGSANFKFTNGAALIATAISLKQFGSVIESYSNLKIREGSLGQILGVLAGAIISFGAIAAVADGMKLTKAISSMVMMVSFVTYLYLFGQVLQSLSNLELGEHVLGAIAIITGAIAALAVLMLAASKLKITSAIGSLLMMVGFVGVLIALGSLLALLSTMQWEQVKNAVVAMIPIVASLFALGFIMKNATSVRLAAMAAVLVGAAFALYELGKTLELLTGITWDSIKGGIAGLAAILGMFLAVSLFTMTIIGFIGEVGALIVLHEYAQELTLFVEELQALSKTNPEAVSTGVQGVVDLISMLKELANDLMSDSGLFKAATDASNLVKTFGQSLGPLCADVATLGGANPENATGSIVAVQGLIDLVLALADTLVQNEGLLEEAEIAAGLAQTFGEKLKALCEDVAILGGSDAENATGSLPVVQGLIDIVLELAGKLSDNQSLIENAIEASKLASNFGDGLRQLCEDTVILGGNVDPEASKASITTVQGLIDVMVALATTLSDNQGLIESGKQAGIVAGEFGAGLLDISSSVVTLGNNADPETSLASVKTVDALIQLMVGLAQQLQDDTAIYESGIDAAALVKSFGTSLKGVVDEVVKLGDIESTDVTANVTSLSKVIGMFLEIAESISKDEGYYDSATKAASSVRKFGFALLPLVGDAFLSSFIDAKQSRDGFKAVKDLINLLLDDLAPKFSEASGLEDRCVSAATALVAFGGALIPLVGEAILSQFINAKKSNDGFAAVKEIINLLVDELAPKFKNTYKFKNCEEAAKACALFAGAVLKLTAAELFSELVDANKALETFEVTKQIASLMLLIAYAFNDNEGMFNSAKNAADACKEFSKAIAKIAKAENRVSKVDAEAALEGLTAVQELISMMVNLAKEFGVDGFDAQVTQATSAIDTFTTKIREIAGVLGGMLTQENWFGGYSKIDVSPVVDMFNSMSQAISTIAGASTNVESAGLVIDKIKEFVNIFGEAGTTATNMAAVTAEIDKMLASFRSMQELNVDNVMQFIDKVGTSSSAITNLTSFNSELTELVRTLTELSKINLDDKDIIDYTKALEDLTKLTDDIENLFDELSELMRELGKTMVDNLASGISGNEAAVNAARKLCDDIYKAISSFTSRFRQLGSQLAQALANGITSASSYARSAGYNLAQYALNGAASTAGQFRTVGYNLGLNLANGLSSSYYSAYNAGVSVSQSAYNGANYYTNSFFNIGYNMCTGLAKGLYAGESIVTRAAQQVAQDSYNAAASTLQINSPSKLFMKLGRGIDEGLARGIDDNGNLVGFAAEQMTLNAINMANQVAAIIEDTTIDPVITPVLDLSSIRRQSSELNGMMSANKSLGLSSRISQAMYDIQNAEPVSQLVTLDTDTLTAMAANGVDGQVVDVRVNFEGSLSQLAAVLQPAIVAETNRIGVNLVKE